MTFTTITGLSQVITLNDDFEGPPVKHTPPPNWHNCNNGVSNGDTQPFSGVGSAEIPASSGNAYLSIVTRQLNPPGTVETVWAELITPFEKDFCYDISLDYCISSELYGTLNWEDYYFNNPARLEILGLGGECNGTDSLELLYSSDVISGYEWETHDIRLHPKLASYPRIALRAAFIAPGIYKNSAILIDNLRLVPHISAFIHDQDMLKVPADAQSIQWYFDDQPVDGANTPDMPFIRTGTYQAEYFDGDGCKQRIREEYILDPSSTFKLYPDPTHGPVCLDYVSDKEIRCSLEFYDMSGRLMKSVSIDVTEGINRIKDDISGFPPSVYYVKFISKGFFAKFKLVKLS